MGNVSSSEEMVKDKFNMERFKAGDEPIRIANEIATQYNECKTELQRRGKCVDIFQERHYKIPICLLSIIYKLFTKISTTRLKQKSYENQPRE